MSLLFKSGHTPIDRGQYENVKLSADIQLKFAEQCQRIKPLHNRLPTCQRAHTEELLLLNQKYVYSCPLCFDDHDKIH